ncbi:MAG: DEAD/DEAH box helicase family protein [Sedimentisphaerales bacterium]|nr:DEAD/DEAH box helicase family protein [Sedimentisphaerales bacterium]
MADSLHKILSVNVSQWRVEDYYIDNFGAISEILEWFVDSESGVTRFLRYPQIRALETYWYLRLKLGTPNIPALYEAIYPNKRLFREALGLVHDDIRDWLEEHDNDYNALFEKISVDNEFVKTYKLESLRETLTLNYPSYIFALAMGAGKTVLIGAIIATEFAMALEYPIGSFVQNALVFAPGKTIIESLRELADIPYDKIIPPRMYKQFMASVKLTFTRDGEKEIPAISGSVFNIIVTNTEKIRIQKETIRKADLNGLFSSKLEDEAKQEVANLRLQKIASLPHLAIFSDEAHHTYGQSMETELKKVRKTVDYLADKTNVIAVINTTGTPYYKRQSLKDVVFWYGLSQGINDGYLKDLAGNIQAFSFEGQTDQYVCHVIEDFFKEYGQHCLPDGSKAKIAIYFPQTTDLKELKPVIEQALIKIGYDPSMCLVNTSDTELTKEDDIKEFNRLNNPDSQKRVMLLVNKGTEGWNCPSLFACSLARKLKSSNNFVLQATTRCLRQIPGNNKKARVYLSIDNFNILDKQLQETYGESISDLNRASQQNKRDKIILKKLNIPPLVVTQIIKTVVKKQIEQKEFTLSKPVLRRQDKLEKRTFTLAQQSSTERILKQLGDTVTIEVQDEGIDLYYASVELANQYHFDSWLIYEQLKIIYPENEIPLSHLGNLAEQVEKHTSNYEIKSEKVDIALALVKPEGFKKEITPDGEIFTADITYHKDKEHLITRLSAFKDKAGEYGFHYDPYNFDSNPEKNFFEQILDYLNIQPKEVEDIFFTGAITDPAKTDFFVEYKDDKGKTRRYTPDFIIRKKPGKGRKSGTGKVYLIEIKAENERTNSINGENGKKAIAIRKWQNLNPEKLRYEMIFTPSDVIAADDLKNVKSFIEENEL